MRGTGKGLSCHDLIHPCSVLAPGQQNFRINYIFQIFHLDYDHGEDPGVDEVLDPVADGVYGVHPAVGGVTGVVLVGGDQHPPVRYRKLKVRQGSARAKTSSQPHHVVHRLPGVLDAPQPPGILLPQVLHQEILQHNAELDYMLLWAILTFLNVQHGYMKQCNKLGIGLYINLYLKQINNNARVKLQCQVYCQAQPQLQLQLWLRLAIIFISPHHTRTQK